MSYFVIRVSLQESVRLKKDYFPEMNEWHKVLYLEKKRTWYWYENEDDTGVTYIFYSNDSALAWNIKSQFKNIDIEATPPDLDGFVVIYGGSPY